MDAPVATIMQCTGCGAKSAFEAGFVRGRKGRISCISCFEYELLQTKSRNRRASLALAGIAALLVFLLPENAWIFFNVALFYLCLYPSLIPHELGHALGALLSGQKIIQITLGSGPLVLAKRCRGVNIEIRSYPTEGLLFKEHRKRSFIKLREFVTVLAGPLANFAVAWFIWFACSGILEHTSPFDQPDPLLALFIANLLLGFSNLLPFNVRTGFGVVPSDGKQLLTIPFMSVTEKLRKQAIAVSFLALNNNDLDACARLCAAGLADYPGNPQLLTIKSILLCKQRDYRAAREIALALLDDASVSDLERALARNNLAWFDYLSGDPALLEEAARMSDTAFSAMPWSLPARSTRGAVLIAAGRAEEGVPLLEDRRFITGDAANRALVACSLAMGYAARGETEKARAALQQAARLDPVCVLLERTQKQIEDLSQSSQRR